MPQEITGKKRIAGRALIQLVRAQEKAIRTVLEALKPPSGVAIAAVQRYLAQLDPPVAEETLCCLMWLDRRGEWMKHVGVLIDSASVATICPQTTTPAAVRGARARGRLIAFKVGSKLLFPAIQFSPTGSPYSWVQVITRCLPDPDSQLQLLGARRSSVRCSYAEQITRSRSPAALVSIFAEMTSQARAIAKAEAR